MRSGLCAKPGNLSCIYNGMWIHWRTLSWRVKTQACVLVISFSSVPHWAGWGAGWWMGAGREERYRNSGVRGVLLNNHRVPNPVLITGLCAGDPVWIRVDWPFVFRSLWWSWKWQNGKSGQTREMLMRQDLEDVMTNWTLEVNEREEFWFR